jgi:hypothetical protein
MSDVEILLQVDAGRTPPGVSAIFMDEDDTAGRWISLALAMIAAGAAVVCVAQSVHLAAVTLLVLAAGLFGVHATPTISAESDRRSKRQVAVMTASSILIRDEQGLHTWRLEDLVQVVAENYNHQSLLMLIDRNGRQYALRPLQFRRGQKLRSLINQRLHARQTGSL